MDSTPYTKREQDLMNASVHEKLDSLIESIKISREERKEFEKTVEPLFRVASENSGDIKKLQLSIEEIRKITKNNSKATELINNITSTWRFTRWVVSLIVSILLFIIAIKNIISGGIQDGLQAIKNLF